jgi:phosphonate transport system substrate-binding protein
MYTGSHDRSIVAVRDRIVDGAAVDSLIYEQAVRNAPDLKTQTRVVARYGPYGSPPMVVNPHAPADFKAALRRALLNMHTDNEGQRILHSLMADRFVTVEDSAYENIREMIREVRPSADQTRR